MCRWSAESHHLWCIQYHLQITDQGNMWVMLKVVSKVTEKLSSRARHRNRIMQSDSDIWC